MSIVPSFFGGRSNNAAYDPLSLDVWDPFEGFPFNSDMWPLSGNFFLTGNARIDWKETADGHVYKVDVPGLKKEEVKVELGDDRVLQISSERNREEEGNGDTWRWVERSRGRFMRRIRLPENAKVNEMTGAMEDGVLTITVPKEGGKKPDVKSIEITEID